MTINEISVYLINGTFFFEYGAGITVNAKCSTKILKRL